MKNTPKTKAAGAGAQQAPDAPADVLRPMEDGPVVHNSEPDATPPDIIIEN
jgi:hypothetical protein